MVKIKFSDFILLILGNDSTQIILNKNKFSKGFSLNRVILLNIFWKT